MKNLQCPINPLYRYVTVNQTTISQLPEDDVPKCLWATMEISTNIEVSETERATYIPDPTINASKSNTNEAIQIVAR